MHYSFIVYKDILYVSNLSLWNLADHLNIKTSRYDHGQIFFKGYKRKDIIIEGHYEIWGTEGGKQALSFLKDHLKLNIIYNQTSEYSNNNKIIEMKLLLFQISSDESIKKENL